MKATKKVKVQENVQAVARVNVAVVMNGKYEVRRYSLVEHGENFAELANEFANKKGYQVEFL